MIFILALLLGRAHASQPANTESSLEPRARSDARVERRKENLKVIQENIGAAERNLKAMANNIQIIEDELTELRSLEDRYEKIRTRYEKFLETASETLREAPPESEERKKVQENIDRANRLYTDARLNLRDVQARRRPLEQQLSSWNNRRQNYSSLLAELTQKKARLEKELTARK